MSIIIRIKQIMSASINDLLDKAENPENMINQAIRDLGKGIMDVRRDAASAIASSKLTGQRIERVKVEIESCRKVALVAAGRSDDSAALKALERKRQQSGHLQQLEKLLEQQKNVASKLKQQLLMLEDRVQQLRGRKELLLSQKRMAQFQRKLSAGIADVNALNQRLYSSPEEIITGFDTFTRMEENIAREMAEAEAELELSEIDPAGKYIHICKDDELQEELQQLKNEAGG